MRIRVQRRMEIAVGGEGADAGRWEGGPMLAALSRPLSDFLEEAEGRREDSLSCEVQREEPSQLGLRVGPYLVRVMDLRRVPLDSFLLSVAGARARAELAGALGLAAAQYLLAGVSFFQDAQAGTEAGAIGFCVEALESTPAGQAGPLIPRGPELRDTWMLYHRLALELQLGARIFSALEHVQRADARQRKRPAERSSLWQELRRDYKLSQDAIAALTLLSDWQRGGGQALLTRVRELERARASQSR